MTTRQGIGAESPRVWSTTRRRLGLLDSIHGKFADTLAHAVEQRGFDTLGCGGRVRVVLNADQACATRSIGEAEAT